MLICISGSSGVGKTTISRLLSLLLGESECVCLSGDDLHLWERNDPAWDSMTHLDPRANDICLGRKHIASLLDGDSIQRRKYNHATGKFDAAETIVPTKHIIYEGLHALHDDAVLSMADLCIFVDTENDLKTEWKIKRDTKKRGYTQSQVLETMTRRRKDEVEYILPQRRNADAIVKFSKTRDGFISLDYVSISQRGTELLISLKEFYESLTEFLTACKWISMDPSLVQGKGGNISVKSESGMIVKSSGCKMSEVSIATGFCVCSLPKRFPKFNCEQAYGEFLNASRKSGVGNPSMETGFHASNANRVVIHTHPIHLNAILCSEQAEEIVESLFSDLPYVFVPYCRPGMNLSNELSESHSIVFLENHGLIVSAPTAQQAFETTERINNRCRRWLSNHIESFVDLGGRNAARPLFPDAAVLPEDMSATNDYILGLAIGACLTPKFLSDAEIRSLNDMESEKYRKSKS